MAAETAVKLRTPGFEVVIAGGSSIAHISEISLAADPCFSLGSQRAELGCLQSRVVNRLQVPTVQSLLISFHLGFSSTDAWENITRSAPASSAPAAAQRHCFDLVWFHDFLAESALSRSDQSRYVKSQKRLCSTQMSWETGAANSLFGVHGFSEMPIW